MAAAILQDMVMKDPKLQHIGFIVKSGGIYDLGERQAAGEAIQVMSEKGLDIRAHRSTHVKDILVDWAEVILVMEHEHQRHIVEHLPHASDKVHLLTEFAGEEGEVADPFGRGLLEYRQCRDELVALLNKVLRKRSS